MGMGIASFQQLVCMWLMCFKLFPCACSGVNTRRKITHGLIKNIFQYSTEDDFSESCQHIQQLETPGTQGTDVNDLLPLARTNFIRKKVKIFCSRKACPISDVIATMEQLSIFNPI